MPRSERPMSDTALCSKLISIFGIRERPVAFYSSSQYSRASIISPVSAALSHQLSANWSTSTPRRYGRADRIVRHQHDLAGVDTGFKCGDQAFRHLTALLEALHPLGGIVPDVHVDSTAPAHRRRRRSPSAGNMSILKDGRTTGLSVSDLDTGTPGDCFASTARSVPRVLLELSYFIYQLVDYIFTSRSKFRFKLLLRFLKNAEALNLTDLAADAFAGDYAVTIALPLSGIDSLLMTFFNQVCMRRI